MFKYLRLCAFLLLTTMVIYSCGGGGGNKGGDNLPISDITLNAAKIVAVKSNNPWQIIVSANGQPVNAGNFTFTSDNDSSASVDENGFLTVKENNNATITVVLKSDPTITASLQVEKHTFEKFYTDDVAVSIFAIDSKGDFYAWGYNEFGQLGVGNFDNQTLPKKVLLPEGVNVLSFNIFSSFPGSSAFALMSDGNLYAWGCNSNGRLGLGSNSVKEPSPKKVLLPEGEKLLSMDNFTIDRIRNSQNSAAFAFTNNGNLYAWGSNKFGELGVGSTNESETSPQQVKFPDGAKLLSMDNFTIYRDGSLSNPNPFALLSDGNLYAWGRNNLGQLGVGSTNESETSPKQVKLFATLLSMDNFTFIDNSAFALLDDGSFYAWGSNYNGELGVGDFTDRESPTLVSFTGGATLSSMDNFTISKYVSAFALLSDGKFYAWGNNGYGRLGVGDTENKPSPTEVLLPATLSSMDNFFNDIYSAFALLSDGKFYAWGNNYYGELGVGDFTDRESPTLVALPATLSSMDNLTYSNGSSFALLNDGSFYSWGYNIEGQLGVNSLNLSEPSPTEIAFPDGATLSSMDNFTIEIINDLNYNEKSIAFALLNDGSFYAWGYNIEGQLGVGSTNDNESSPMKVTLPATLSSMDNFTIGEFGSAFTLLDNGLFYGWGNNYYGQLGVNSSNMGEPSPQKVLIPDDEKLLSYDKFINGYANTFFITDKGFLYSMGMGDYGQLGNGSTDNQNTPQNVW